MYRDVYLNLLPVCECGEILRDAYRCRVVGDVAHKRGHVSVEINSVCCPFCGETINGFKVRQEYLNMFKTVQN